MTWTSKGAEAATEQPLDLAVADLEDVNEARRLLDAALAREPQLAAQRLAEHISHTARLLISCANDEHVYSSDRAS